MAIGIWFIGARGSVATTTITGIAALSAGAAGTQGLVTELTEFADVPLPAIDQFVIGGHDISQTHLQKRAEDLAAEGVFPSHLLRIAADVLEATDARIRTGIFNDQPQRAAIQQIQRDINEFKTENNLDSVIVVNVSSTEELLAADDARDTLAALDAALDAGHQVLAISSIYAYAALDAGFAFVDFTPSMGARIPALDELAIARSVPYAGSDGKTGETLVKTTLAPMFSTRNLKVRSWAGLNLLGGGDGQALADPARKATKLASKAHSLEASLGYAPQHPIHIEYVEDMGEWKTAWNQISFEGFLGTGMKLQFTWEGCDSALAAPLVIDLVRLTALAHSNGNSGALGSLAFFFKDPAGSTEHRLNHQFDELVQWASTLSA